MIRRTSVVFGFFALALEGCQAHGVASGQVKLSGDAHAEVGASAEASATIKLSEVVQLVDDRLEYRDREIDFEYDKASLQGDGTIEVLGHIRDVMKQHPIVTLHIEGHADSRGDDNYNKRLSDDRAAAVRKWLMDKGIDPARLTSKGYGADRKDREPARCRDKTGSDAQFKNDRECLEAWHESRHTVFRVVSGVEELRKHEAVDKEPERQVTEPTEAPVRKIWLGLWGSRDYAWFPDGPVCLNGGQENNGFTCLRSDNEIYRGNPVKQAGNALVGGPYGSTWRVLASIDLVVASHLTVGARLGYALGGGPTSTTGGKFLPLHGELRLSYWLLNDSFKRTGLRPFAFLAGGLAQVETDLPGVSVREQDNCSNYATGLCTVYSNGNIVQQNPQDQTIHAWHRSGIGFIGLGLGTMFAFAERHGPVLDVRFSRMSSGDTWVLSPELGYLVGF